LSDKSPQYKAAGLHSQNGYFGQDRLFEHSTHQQDSRDQQSPRVGENLYHMQGSGYSPANADIKIFSGVKQSIEDLDRQRHMAGPSQDTPQRVVFQRNYDAVNQVPRTLNDQPYHSATKKDDKIINELSSAKRPANPNFSMDQENIPSPSASNTLMVQESSPLPKSSSTDAELKLSSKNDSQNNNVEKEIVIVEELILNANQSRGSSDSKSASQKVSSPERIENSSENVKSRTSSESDNLLASQSQKDQTNGRKSPPNSNTEPSMEAKDETSLKQTDMTNEDTEQLTLGHEDKENIAPSQNILDSSSGVNTDKPMIAASTDQIMDFDKDPAFAEDNLEVEDPLIVDDDKSPSLQRPTDDIQIKEADELVITTNRSAEENVSNREQVNQDLFGELVKQFQQTSAENSNQKSVQNNENEKCDERTFTNLKVSVVQRKRSQASHCKTLGLHYSRSNSGLKPSLVKRPPVINSSNKEEPSTPKSKPQSYLSNIKSLQASKEAIKQRNSPTLNSVQKTSEIKNKVLTSSSKPAVSAVQPAANDKLSRKPSVPKFSNRLAQIQVGSKYTEIKLATDIPARQAEAESILLQKKPPVPKFTPAQVQRSSSKTSSRVESQEPLPRKPAVPKLNELLKKK
jgi:hypothetical protein